MSGSEQRGTKGGWVLRASWEQGRQCVEGGAASLGGDYSCSSLKGTLARLFPGVSELEARDPQEYNNPMERTYALEFES